MIELDAVQEKAISELGNGKVLCGGVGSGKSRTALVYWYKNICKGELCINGYGHDGAIKKPVDLYIITTAKKRDSLEWEGELAPLRLSKGSRSRFQPVSVVVDSWNNIKRYTDVQDAFFIFDEQRLVGHGVWVRSFLKIVKNNQWVMLTATPGDNWLDYCALFVANGFYRNRTEYLRRHVIYASWSKFPKVEGYQGTGVLEARRQAVLVQMPYKPQTVRHHKDIWCEYNKDKLDVAMKDCWDVFNNEPITNVSSMGYICRRVINEHPSRLDAVVKILKESKLKRAIIFYNFNYELEILRTLDGIDGMTVAEWNGQQHEPIPDSDMWVYLVQYTSGSEGWNCVETDTIIFYSLNYSYRITEQAEGRIDRRNTTFRDLNYYYLKSHSSVDNAIWKALRTKKKFNEKAFYQNYLTK